MMKDMGIVQGSPEMAVPLVVGKDTVYVHTDIIPVEGEEGLFQYHEVQYEKDEYIKMLAEKNQSLEEQMTDTQLALVEVYELLI